MTAILCCSCAIKSAWTAARSAGRTVAWCHRFRRRRRLRTLIPMSSNELSSIWWINAAPPTMPHVEFAVCAARQIPDDLASRRTTSNKLGEWRSNAANVYISSSTENTNNRTARSMRLASPSHNASARIRTNHNDNSQLQFYCCYCYCCRRSS